MSQDQQRWLDLLELEHDNLRSALEWSLEDPAGGEPGVRLAGALARFWHWRGHVSEGRDRIGRALGREGGTPATRSRALTMAGLLEWRFGNTETARDWVEQSVELAVQAGDQAILASALRYRAYLAAAVDDRTGAHRHATECLDVARASEDGRELAWALAFSGFLAYCDDDLVRAESLLDEALALGRKMADHITTNSALVALGAVALAKGNHTLARRQFQEALEVARHLDFKLGTADALTGLADCARVQGEFGKAATRYVEALKCYAQAGERRQIAGALERYAALCSAVARFETATQLFGAADRLFEVTGGCLPPRPSADHRRDVWTTRHAIGDERFEALWREGQALSVEHAIACALRAIQDIIPSTVGCQAASGAPSVTVDAGLTRREREVLRLLASGASNQHIAETLVIGVRTAETHVERILRKLGVGNRAEAMLWARAHEVPS